jgi:hypothetical protein
MQGISDHGSLAKTFASYSVYTQFVRSVSLQGLLLGFEVVIHQ